VALFLPTTSGFAVAQNDIPAHVRSSKKLKLAPSPFEAWEIREGYDIAPAVLPAANRTYADRQTQVVYEAYKACAADTARIVTQSTLETEALREKLTAIAVE
jgi:hypothetical protein